jgi:transcriptional regulator with GAF, ATPase, and Fis domain
MTTTAASARLIAVSGPCFGDVFVLDGEQLVLGRDTGNAIAIADPALSRRHCAIVRDDGGWLVRDLGSFNGTLLNGERITERRLEHGDRLALGATALLFHAEVRDPPPSAVVSELPNTATLRLDESIYLNPSSPLPDRGRTERDLRALLGVAARVAGIRERQRLECELLDAAFEVVPAAEAAFVRVDPGTQECSVVETRTRDGRTAAPPSDTVLNLAIGRREALLTNTPLDQPMESASSITSRLVTGVLAVPLLDESLVAGVLYLVTSSTTTAFDRLHLEVVTALAGIGSLALRNIGRLESLLAETERLKQKLRITHQMLGSSEAMQQVYKFVEKTSSTDLTVLITGETGTGKELAARALHENSPRAARPFVAINCAAFPDTLLESELFGHERGAFSGAVAAKPGKLELANRGTVFLDEVGELSLSAQAKLLRVLQFREVERIGALRPIRVDIRIISATNRDLHTEVKEKRFRDDLLFRLEVLRVHMPALRERRQDIPVLAEHFAAAAAKRSRRGRVTLSAAALRRLQAYDWPGNVRQLENAIERAIVLSDDPEIGPDDLPEVVEAAASEPGGESRFHSGVADAKRRLVTAALDETGGNVTEAARLLGLNPNYLHRLINNLGLRA